MSPQVALTFPVAPGQEWYVEHVWSQQDLSPDRYHSFAMVEYASRLLTRIDSGALAEAFDTVTRRHQMLRTHLSTLDPQARLICAPRPERPVLSVTDLRHADDPYRAALALIEERRREPIDPTSPGLVRPSLFRLGTQDCVLLTRAHHSVLDAWALALLYDELWATYQDLVHGRPVSAQPPPFEYSDLVAAQQRALDGGAQQRAPSGSVQQRTSGSIRERRLAYWARTVADASAGLLLPADADRDRVETFREGLSPFTLSPEWTARARAFCAQERVTLPMLLLAAQAALLRRYAPVEQVRIGSTFGGRDGPEEQRLIGPVYYGVFYRITVGDDPSVRELLRRVRDAVFGAIEHRCFPYWALLDRLGLREDPALPVDRKRLYDAYFDLLPRSVTHTDPDAPNPLAQRRILLDRAPAGFALPTDSGRRRAWQRANVAFNLQESADRVHGVIAYNAAAFRRARMDAMARDYCLLLQSFPGHPDARV